MKQEVEKKVPVSVAHGVPNLKHISGKLKVLYTAARVGDCEFYELLGFQDIAMLTLKQNIDELDEIITDIAKQFGIEETWR